MSLWVNKLIETFIQPFNPKKSGCLLINHLMIHSTERGPLGPLAIAFLPPWSDRVPGVGGGGWGDEGRACPFAAGPPQSTGPRATTPVAPPKGRPCIQEQNKWLSLSESLNHLLNRFAQIHWFNQQCYEWATESFSQSIRALIHLGTEMTVFMNQS